MTSLAPQIRSKTATDELLAAFGYRDFLQSNNSTALTGSPTVTAVLYPTLAATTTLSIGTTTLNGSTMLVDGQDHSASQAVVAMIGGGTPGAFYLLTCTAAIDTGGTKQIKGILGIEH
jgi:hypothetical protein